MGKSNKISVVIPVYQGEHSLPELIQRIQKSLAHRDYGYEVILINDGSKDNSWEIIKDIHEKNLNIKGINLSRNFGQHYAIMAGLEAISGNWAVVMDCDLQDKPEEIDNLYNKAKEGYDIVLAERLNRQDHYFKRLSSTIFYSLLSYFTEVKQNKNTANFGIYHLKVIKAVISLEDKIKVFPLMVKWVGFKSTQIKVSHSKRKYGKSTYSLKKLVSLGTDIILSFSNKPLRLTVKFGFLMSFISLIIGFFYFIKYLSGGISVSGYTSIILSILFLSGAIISFIGIVGLYVGKIFDNTKQRPNYIISDLLDNDS